MRKEAKLTSVLNEIESLPWDHDLYISELEPDSPALVLKEEDEELNEKEQVLVVAEKGM